MPNPSRLLLPVALLTGALGGDAVPAAASAAATMPAVHAAARKPAVFGPAVLHALNQVRRHYHLPTVSADRRMSRAAYLHSHDMAHNHYFAHGAWSGRVARSAGEPHSMGEVLGWLTRASARQEAAWLVRSWLASPPHRAVLLNGNFRRVGIGRADGKFDRTPAAVYTVDFATPR